MKLLTDAYLDEYRRRQRLSLDKHLARLQRRSARSGDAARWATIAGAVASSQKEGSRVTVVEYMNARNRPH